MFFCNRNFRIGKFCAVDHVAIEQDLLGLSDVVFFFRNTNVVSPIVFDFFSFKAGLREGVGDIVATGLSKIIFAVDIPYRDCSFVVSCNKFNAHAKFSFC